MVFEFWNQLYYTKMQNATTAAVVEMSSTNALFWNISTLFYQCQIDDCQMKYKVLFKKT